MNYYVDIHANILPGLSGIGSRPLTEAEAAERVTSQREGNIKLAVAAPYFQPEQCSQEDFLQLRDAAIERLSEAAQPMRIVPGAVVPYDYCQAHPRELAKFAIGGCNYILIDLPPAPPTAEFCEELKKLRIVSGLCPIAVDIDRYFESWSPENWIELRQSEIFMQISVNGLLQPESRKLSLYLLANSYAQFIATGSRSVEEPLHFTEAMRMVQRSLPAQIYRRVKNNAGMLLSNAEPSSFQ
ncbi:MAG: hypothetical protein IK130_01705 [Oscillospiraceae bacterium]|nr:hypothetical protein [Oscillospiraceae bacterium]